MKTELKVSKVKKEKVMVVEEEVREYVLSLSHEEAEILMDLVGMVGGPMNKTRHLLENIWRGLNSKGVQSAHNRPRRAEWISKDKTVEVKDCS